jgi:hypothetical protein
LEIAFVRRRRPKRGREAAKSYTRTFPLADKLTMTCLIRAALLGLTFAAAPAAAELMHYRGLCDASAAVALGPEHFVVADDESNILTIYRRGQGEATATLDLTDYLGRVREKARGKAREADIEGAARIGDRIYWIASHGRNSKGKPQEARRRLFATDLVTTAAGPSIKAAPTSPYLTLIEDLVADPRFAAVATASAQAIAPEDAGGLNIEGLAATPAGELLIGFRNPLPQGKALLLRLKNPAAVQAARNSCQCGLPIFAISARTKEISSAYSAATARRA